MLAEDLAAAARGVLRCVRTVSPSRSVLVAVSGIDGSGKGYVTARLRDALERQKLRVAVINIDGWLNLSEKRFSASHESSGTLLCECDPLRRDVQPPRPSVAGSPLNR